MSNITSAGNLAVAQNLSVGGTSTATTLVCTTGTFSAGVTTNNVNASGTVTGNSLVAGFNGIDCNGDIIVIGNTTLDSDLVVSGSATVDTNMEVVGNFKVDGNTTQVGTTTQTGAATFNGASVTTNANLNVVGNMIANGATISPLELSYLDGGTQNLNTAVTTLQTKCTDLTHSGTTNTMANNFVVSGNETVNGTITANGNINMNANIIANTATISPTELSYLDGGTQNINTAVTALQQKTTTLSYNGFTITTIANELQVGDKFQAANTATFNGQIVANAAINMNSNLVANGATISPAEMSYLDGGTSNIQTHFNTVDSNVSTLQTKCTDLTHSGTTNTMANNLVVNGTLNVSNALYAQASGMTSARLYKCRAGRFLEYRCRYRRIGSTKLRSRGRRRFQFLHC